LFRHTCGLVVLPLLFKNSFLANSDQISKQEKISYYPLLSFLTLTVLTTYPETGAMSFAIFSNILNVVAPITSAIGT